MSTDRVFDILLAEDDEVDVELMQRAFHDAKVPHRLRVVRDGQSAIDFLSGLGRDGHGPAPALVLLDVKMPRRSGLEVLAWMKAEDGLRCIPVIIFSASALSRDVEPAYASGASIYLVKPNSIKDRAEVAAFIADWLALGQTPLAATHGVNSAQAFMQAWLRFRPQRPGEGTS